MPSEVEMRHVYKGLAWETIARAYLSRYPRHAEIPMMLAQELTSVAWDPAAARLTVARRMKADLEAPFWLKRLFGVYHAYMWQEHTIDFNAKLMKTVSHSNPDSKLYRAGEVATWQPDPDDPAHSTLFTVRAFLHLERFFLNVQSVIEGFLLRSFQTQFANARKIDMRFVALLSEADAARSRDQSSSASASASASASLDDPRALLEESIASWIERSLRVQGAANIADIVPVVLGPAPFAHAIEIGPVEGKQL